MVKELGNGGLRYAIRVGEAQRLEAAAVLGELREASCTDVMGCDQGGGVPSVTFWQPSKMRVESLLQITETFWRAESFKVLENGERSTSRTWFQVPRFQDLDTGGLG